MARSKDRQMDEVAFKAAVHRKIVEATGYQSSELTAQRDQALQYYRGDPRGDEVEGRSKVISRDVMDTIEWMTPSLMEMFHGSETVVEYQPQEQEDEDFAQQATDYINHIYNIENNGFAVTLTWLKDAMMQKLGVVKHWCETADRTKESYYSGLTEDEVAAVTEDDDVEIVEGYDEDSGREAEIPTPPDLVMQGVPPSMTVVVYDIKIRRTWSEKAIRVCNVPPEEFLIEPNATTQDDAKFMAHQFTRTRSSLLEEGYDEDIVDGLPSHGGLQESTQTGTADLRYKDEGNLEAETTDRSLDEILITEAIVWIDYDGDGRAERRRVVMAGDGDVVLLNEEFSDDLFSIWTPVPLPHSVWGLSVADLTMDIQDIKTALWRQMLDGLYITNDPTATVYDPDGQSVNYDDLTTPTVPGKRYRVKGQGRIEWDQKPWPGAQAFPMLEYLDYVRKQRSGVSDSTQGLDPDALRNTTATAVDRSMSAAQQRIQMIARVFAETGFKSLFKALLRLTVKYQDKERTVRLRNQWVPVDPRAWNSEMDVSINVGLGSGNKSEHVAHLARILEIQKEAISTAPGMGLVGPKHIYSTLEAITKAVGMPSVDPYFADPEGPEGMQIAQQFAQMQQQNQQPQADMVYAQAEMEKAQAQTMRIQADAMQKQAETQMKEREFAFEVEKAVTELQLKARELGHEINLDWAEQLVKVTGNGR